MDDTGCQGWSRREMMRTTLGLVALGGIASQTTAGWTSGPTWHDVSDWPIEGRVFTDRALPFDRLPKAAKGVVRDPVWNLSRQSAGMVVRFGTDASSFRLRYTLSSEQLAMPHMPATGVSGIDVYALDRTTWRWLAVTRPTSTTVEATLDGLSTPGRYMLYLPLYNRVDRLEIGVPDAATIAPLDTRSRPVVFYGTSITQGACASRPGMAYPAILGRRLGCHTVNLGFSGNGRMEMAVARSLVKIDASTFVIDCLPNMNAGLVRERTIPFVLHLRKHCPTVPIVLVEDRTWASAPLRGDKRRHHAASRQALREAFEQLEAKGVDDLQYVRGETLLGDDGEATVDGSHPSDLGMTRYASALFPSLSRAQRWSRLTTDDG